MENKNDSSTKRMLELINHGSKDASLRANVSETVDYKVNGPDGNTYGVVRENQKYFIKESKDGVEFNYIGGIGNKTENEYPSYNSAYRNLELKMREMSTSNNAGKIFESFKPAVQAEYIVEATEDMRKELDRFRQITNGAQSIMKESNTEFINKPKFKDPEGFGTATDPKKQGAPFTGEVKATLDKDPKSSSKTPKNAGTPFEGDIKVDPTKFDIEKTNNAPDKAGDPFTTPAKDVLGNSVATLKPKGGKVIKVTESQMAQVRKRLSEGYFDDDNESGYDDGEESDILKQFNYDVDKIGGKRYKPTHQEVKSFDDSNDFDEHFDKPDEDDEIDEGLWNTIKGIGSAGKALGKAGSTGVSNGIGKAATGVKNAYNNAATSVSNGIGKAATGVGNAYNNVSGIAQGGYNQSQMQSSQSAVDKIANNLKNELINLNDRTVKSGGQALNYASVIQSLSNKLRGQLPRTQKNPMAMESVEDDSNDDLVNEITEAVLNAFGQHPTYQKAAFTTGSDTDSLVKGTHEWDDQSVKGQKPYGSKIGSSAPFTVAVKQKVGEGEISEDADSVQQGKSPQGLPKLGQKGDVAPFNKPVEKSGDKIAKGTPVQKGETQPAKAELGKKGDKAPFDKPVKKSEVINKLAESIIADLKKKR